jgi:hypothetical protein
MQLNLAYEEGFTMQQHELDKLAEEITSCLGEAVTRAWDRCCDDAAVIKAVEKILKDYDVEKELKDYAKFRAEWELV